MHPRNSTTTPSTAALFVSWCPLLPLLGRDPRHWGQNNDIDLTAIAAIDYPVHARIDVRQAALAKQRAQRLPCQPGRGLGRPNLPSGASGSFPAGRLSCGLAPCRPQAPRTRPLRGRGAGLTTALEPASQEAVPPSSRRPRLRFRRGTPSPAPCHPYLAGSLSNQATLPQNLHSLPNRRSFPHLPSW